jgi:hypothetical protein
MYCAVETAGAGLASEASDITCILLDCILNVLFDITTISSGDSD